MPIPFLNSITLNKNEIQEFKVYNLTPDPTLTSAGDYGYMWLNTSDSPKTLKWWDGTSIRSIVDSGNTSTLTVGTANDLSGGVAGSLPYQQGVGDTTFLGIGSSGYILTSTGSAPQWSASIPSSSVSGLAASATTDTTNASNISSGTLGLARLSLASGQFYVGDGSNNPAATAKSSIPLSGFGNAAADINIGGFKITNSGTIGSGDADSTVATKGYVDSVAQGLDVKASCLVATTADITLASPGAVTIDGIYSATDFTAGTTRILVKDQSAPAENGIYIWQGPSSAMTRSADANTWDELVGAFTFIERGTANADSGWVCTVNAGGTLGSTAVTWVKFSQAGSYTAGNGIVQSGTSFNFAQSSAYTAGQIPFASSTTAMGFSANLHWDNANNRLGIGTATPKERFEIAGLSGNIRAYGRAGITYNSLSSNLYYDGSIWTRDSVGGAVSIGLDTVTDNAITFSTTAATSGFPTERLKIASDGVCTWSNVGGVAGTAMTLNGTGLGIGTATISERLTVSGNVLATDSAGTYPRFISTVGAKSWEIGYRSGTTNYELREDGTTRLVVANGGNVGIGTTTPAYKLSVNGRISYSGVIGEGADATLSSSGTVLLHGNSSTWTEQRFYALGNEQHRISSSGVFTWYDGAGGTRMTLNGTGLGVGVSPSFRLDVKTSTDGNHIRVSGAGQNAITFGNNTSTAGQGFLLGRSVSSDNANNFFLYDLTSGNTRLLIDSSGNLIRGDTTADSIATDAATMVNIGNFAVQYTKNTGNFLVIKPGAPLGTVDICADARTGAYPDMRFFTGGSSRLLIDSAGNLGLGVTPKAWRTSVVFKAFQIGYTGALYSLGASEQVNLASNYYQDTSGNELRIENGYVTRYQQASGAHIWSNAGTGNAGTGFTLTPAMTLDASGNLGVGGSPTATHRILAAGPSAWMGLQRTSGVTNVLEYLDSSGVRLGYIGYVNNELHINQSKADKISFATGSTPAERLSIKSTGQVNFVGQASDPAGAAGDVVYNSTSNRLKYHNGTAWVNTGTNKYSGALAGSGTSFTVTHNLGTRDVTVAVRKSGSTYDQVFTDVQMTDTNTVTIIFASSVTGSDYTVTVIG